ncbi:MAG: hypothetical protein JWQ09_2049 [Segetibacter sp.]|nr:hypothetical protein [Segetibacter sp.]
MRQFSLALLFFIACSFKNSTIDNADAITGKWMSTKGNLEVEVFKTGKEYKAKVIWFDDRDDKSRPMNTRCDKWNPDEQLRKQKILGMEVMKGLVYNANVREWQNGVIYDARSGKYYSASAVVTSAGLLKVRGYWHIRLFGQTMSFKKV